MHGRSLATQPALLFLAFSLAPAILAQAPTALDFQDCAESILPDESELAWQRIGWRTTFSGAVLEADRVDKPVLLWAMNGHPLGCT